MISASEAKKLTRKAQFSNSCYASLATIAIREACKSGKDTVEIHIPLEVVPDMVTFLCDCGFEEVVAAGTITGATVSISW